MSGNVLEIQKKFPTMSEVALCGSSQTALPTEMLDMVFHNLKPRTQLTVKSVCKQWSAIADRVIRTSAALPPSILEKVFHLLSPQELKAAVLVCRWWREVGEQPRFWTWVYPSVDQFNMDDAPNMLDLMRLKKVGTLAIGHCKISEELLQKIRVPRLKKLKMNRVDFSLAKSHCLMIEGFIKLDEAILSSSLSTDQATSLLKCLRDGTKLKRLNLHDTDLSSVAPELLVQGMCQVNGVDLPNTNLTPQQSIAIFTALAAKEAEQLKLISLNNDLSSLDPDLLAEGVNNLEDASLFATGITEQQIEKILTQCLVFTSLKELRISGPFLHSMDQDKLFKLIKVAGGAIRCLQVGRHRSLYGHFEA